MATAVNGNQPNSSRIGSSSQLSRGRIFSESPQRGSLSSSNRFATSNVNNLTNISRIGCNQHIGRILTHFCKKPGCMIGLCDRCIPIHNEFHQERQDYAEIEGLEDVRQHCVNQLNQARLDCQNTSDSLKNQLALSKKSDQSLSESGLAEAEKRIIEVVQTYFGNLRGELKLKASKEKTSSSSIEAVVGQLEKVQGKVEEMVCTLKDSKYDVGLLSKSLTKEFMRSSIQDLKKAGESAALELEHQAGQTPDVKIDFLGIQPAILKVCQDLCSIDNSDIRQPQGQFQQNKSVQKQIIEQQSQQQQQQQQQSPQTRYQQIIEQNAPANYQKVEEADADDQSLREYGKPWIYKNKTNQDIIDPVAAGLSQGEVNSQNSYNYNTTAIPPAGRYKTQNVLVSPVDTQSVNSILMSNHSQKSKITTTTSSNSRSKSPLIAIIANRLAPGMHNGQDDKDINNQDNRSTSSILSTGSINKKQNLKIFDAKPNALAQQKQQQQASIIKIGQTNMQQQKDIEREQQLIQQLNNTDTEPIRKQMLLPQNINDVQNQQQKSQTRQLSPAGPFVYTSTLYTKVIKNQDEPGTETRSMYLPNNNNVSAELEQGEGGGVSFKAKQQQYQQQVQQDNDGYYTAGDKSNNNNQLRFDDSKESSLQQYQQDQQSQSNVRNAPPSNNATPKQLQLSQIIANQSKINNDMQQQQQSQLKQQSFPQNVAQQLISSQQPRSQTHLDSRINPQGQNNGQLEQQQQQSLLQVPGSSRSRSGSRNNNIISSQQLNSNRPLFLDSQRLTKQQQVLAASSQIAQLSERQQPFHRREPSSDDLYQLNIPDWFDKSSTAQYLHFFQPKSSLLHLVSMEDLRQAQRSQRSQVASVHSKYNNSDASPVKFYSISLKADQNNLFQVTRFHKSLVLPDGSIYFIGGINQSNSLASKSIYKYEVGTCKFLKLADMLNGRSGFGCVYSPANLSIFVIGGQCDDGNTNAVSNKCERYDVQTNKWISISSLSSPAFNPVVCYYVSSSSQNNTTIQYLLKFGGKLNDQHMNSSIERFNIKLNVWEVLKVKKQPQQILVSSGLAFQINSQAVLIFGGSQNQNGEKTTECTYFFPESLAIEQCSYQLPFAESFSNSVVIPDGNALYCLQNVSEQSNSSVIYLDRKRILALDQKGWMCLNEQNH